MVFRAMIAALFLFTGFCLGQTCSNDDCDQLIIADLHGEFAQWPVNGSDCNADGIVNLLDFTSMMNEVPAGNRAQTHAAPRSG